jgi:four helix bundle protein
LEKKELERRTLEFALRIVSFVSSLPKAGPAHVMGNQLLRSGTSIGANDREDNRASSRIDFIYKISLSEKEAAETEYWLELADNAVIGDGSERAALMAEARELVAIFTRIGKTSKANLKKHRENPKFEIRNSKS